MNCSILFYDTCCFFISCYGQDFSGTSFDFHGLTLERYACLKHRSTWVFLMLNNLLICWLVYQLKAMKTPLFMWCQNGPGSKVSMPPIYSCSNFTDILPVIMLLSWPHIYNLHSICLFCPLCFFLVITFNWSLSVWNIACAVHAFVNFQCWILIW